MIMHERAFARECVKLAAKESTTRYVREWLTRDESGTWERMALDLMRQVPAYVYHLNYIQSSIAARIRFTACTAVLNKNRKPQK